MTSAWGKLTAILLLVLLISSILEAKPRKRGNNNKNKNKGGGVANPPSNPPANGSCPALSSLCTNLNTKITAVGRNVTRMMGTTTSLDQLDHRINVLGTRVEAAKTTIQRSIQTSKTELQSNINSRYLTLRTTTQHTARDVTRNISRKIDVFKTDLTTGRDSLVNRVGNRVDGTVNRVKNDLSRKMDRIDTNVNNVPRNVERRLNARMSRFQSTISSYMASQLRVTRKHLVREIGSRNSAGIGRKLDRMEKRFNNKYRDLKNDMNRQLNAMQQQVQAQVSQGLLGGLKVSLSVLEAAATELRAQINTVSATIPTMVRLAGGQSHTGRVEIYYQGEWGTVCDDNWDDNDAQVVCRALGFDHGVVASCNAGSGRIWLDEVQCSGAEASLSDCRKNNWGIHDCSHSEDAGVYCYDGQPEYGFSTMETSPGVTTETTEAYVETTSESSTIVSSESAPMSSATWPWMTASTTMEDSTTQDMTSPTMETATYGWVSYVHIRLVNGGTPDRGRVEVFYDGAWGTVCDDYWDDRDAQVVCRQLGFRASGARATPGESFNRGWGHIWMDNVECTGQENSLAMCSFNGWGRHDCSHHEDAGVICG